MDNKKILIVDDDPDIVNIIQLLMESEGYETVAASDGKTAIDLIDEDVDLIILDVMLPETNGFHICHTVRQFTNVPIMFISAMSGDSEKVTALLAGGDDYICKPFSSSELIARVKSLLRRYHTYGGSDSKPASHKKEVSIALGSDNTMLVNDGVIKLSYTEYEIMNLLLQSRGKIFSSAEIFESIWGEPYNSNSNNVIMVHIFKLRKKLEDDYKHPRILKTAWGRGYYIE